MKYFLDTEFEPTPPAQLLSMAVVAEDGSSFYYETHESLKAEEWYPTLFVRDHVLPRLYVRNKRSNYISDHYFNELKIDTLLANQDELRRLLVGFIGTDTKPYFYAWYGAQDWVFIVQLFGGQFSNMPKDWPGYYIDLKVMVQDYSKTKEQVLEAVPKPTDAHFALADALWNRELYRWLTTQ